MQYTDIALTVVLCSIAQVPAAKTAMTPHLMVERRFTIVTQSEKTGLIAHVSRFHFSPRTHSYMNKLSNFTFKIS